MPRRRIENDQRAAVRFGDATCDRQSQADTRLIRACLLGRGVIVFRQSHEALENSLAIFFRDASSLVDDPD